MTDPEIKPTPGIPPATDVGSILKQARLRRGQSYEVVFQHTRIPKKFLEALENNRFDEFPAAVYLQGFLKGYCEHLDLDFEPLWNQIQPPKSRTELSKETKTSEPPIAPERNPTPPSALKAGEMGPASAYLPFAAIVVVGIVAVIGAIWGVGKLEHKAAPTPPLSQRPPEPLPPVIKPPEKMSLKVIFLNETWISLSCDDHLRFEGRGPGGMTQTWSASKEFKLRTSTPGDLRIELDGKNFPLASAARNASGEYLIRRP